MVSPEQQTQNKYTRIAQAQKVFGNDTRHVFLRGDRALRRNWVAVVFPRGWLSKAAISSLPFGCAPTEELCETPHPLVRSYIRLRTTAFPMGDRTSLSRQCSVKLNEMDQGFLIVPFAAGDTELPKSDLRLTLLFVSPDANPLQLSRNPV